MIEEKYKFSIVTAVYNTEKYLAEMIESIISQDIGVQHIQLILIDDGSTDSSLDICKRYAGRYPENILVLEKSHKGVSHARNTGLKYVQGKYINFLDSDDKLETDVLSKVWEFFEQQTEDINLIAIPMVFFDQVTGEHILNDKFEKNGVIDIQKNYKYIQLSGPSTFIRRNVIRELQFNEKLSYAEDAQFINKIILKTGKYGVVANTSYYYRRRSDHSSSIQVSHTQKAWYINYIENFSCDLIREMKKDANKEYRLYLQYLVMYDLQWRANNIRYMHKYISKKDSFLFLKEFRKVIKNISWKILLQQQNLNRGAKGITYLLKLSTFNMENLRRGDKYDR